MEKHDFTAPAETDRPGAAKVAGFRGCELVFDGQESVDPKSRWESDRGLCRPQTEEQNADRYLMIRCERLAAATPELQLWLVTATRDCAVTRKKFVAPSSADGIYRFLL